MSSDLCYKVRHKIYIYTKFCNNMYNFIKLEQNL